MFFSSLGAVRPLSLEYTFCDLPVLSMYLGLHGSLEMSTDSEDEKAGSCVHAFQHDHFVPEHYQQPSRMKRLWLCSVIHRLSTGAKGRGTH